MTDSPSLLDGFDLPPPWPESLLPRIQAHNACTLSQFAVLDDDPLGGQCLHDIAVYTDMDWRRLSDELRLDRSFLLLTDTRAMARNAAVSQAEDAGHALLQAVADTGHLVTPLWRSDSTLRGHFWWEMQAFAEVYPGDGAPEPVFVFIPYFGDGGRFTVDDVHYAHQDGGLRPVAETEFARDPAFAFAHSHLPAWLGAHSDSYFDPAEVVSISLDDLRKGGPDRVADRLMSVPEGGAVIVNAADDRDLEVFVAGLQTAEDAGGYFLCSGAAPFIRVRLGQEKQPLLRGEGLGLSVASQHDGNLQGDPGGLTIVGSYVDTTTAQLNRAVAGATHRSFELTLRAEDHARLAGGISEHLTAGEDVILHTPRGYVDGASSRIADSLSSVVDLLDVRPRYLLVKGGSTASTLAKSSLAVRRATVLGQLLPGVPVWRLGDESKWPGLPFVIFAGNVGTSESLAEALKILRGG